MKRKNLAQFLCAAVVAGVVASAVPALPAMATEVKGGETVSTQSNYNYQLEQLTYAIEEMKIAIDLLYNADLTNIENLNRMTIFGSTAVERSRGLGIKEGHEWFGHIEWIEDSLVELHNVSYRINRVNHAIKNVEIVFSADRNDTIPNKQNVINTLNEVLTQEMNAGVLNHATLRSAVDVLHQYAAQIPATLK